MNWAINGRDSEEGSAQVEFAVTTLVLLTLLLPESLM